MTPAHNGSSKVTVTHQAKLAYIYIRQSSLGQLTRHSASTELQYRLVERAASLGWPPDRIQIIDEDLGKSGATATLRVGFQRLLAEIGLARVGLVTSFDASRLARNNSDWYQLLELCSVFGTLIADSEQLYDPRLYHDRILLGLSGIMSEAELHHIKMRMHAGERHKAEQGALPLSLPVGLVRQRDGQVILNPDEEVQARLQLVFAKFTELGSAHAVMRYCQHQRFLLPTRPLSGPEPHEVCWHPATTSRVLAILHNPAYAGAYVYGRSTIDPTRRTAGHAYSGQVHRPLSEWLVCLQGRYPAYIPWEHYLANRARLQDNQNRYQHDRHGVPRKGQALLQGILRCWRCGARMRLRYSGSHGEYPVYECTYDQQCTGQPRCQEVRAIALDTEVERLFWQALAPDQVELALAAFTHAEQEAASVQRQWTLRRERAQYEADRARRQYQLSEPEHRLVARSLERHWEEKLRAAEAVEAEYQQWCTQAQLRFSEQDRHALVALGTDLPRVWTAPSTTNAERKQLVRLIIHEVLVDNKREPGKGWCRILWQTGATTDHSFARSTQSYRQHPAHDALRQRVLELNHAGQLDADIATTLNAEGWRPARGLAFSSNLIWLLRHQWRIPTVKINGKTHNPVQWPDGTYSVSGVAAQVGVIPGTVHHWVREGRLHGTQLRKGMPWQIHLTLADIEALQQYVKRVRRLKRSNREVI